MSIQAKTFDNGARTSESTVVELNRVVAQAEELLRTLGEEGGAAARQTTQSRLISRDATSATAAPAAAPTAIERQGFSCT